MKYPDMLLVQELAGELHQGFDALQHDVNRYRLLAATGSEERRVRMDALLHLCADITEIIVSRFGLTSPPDCDSDGLLVGAFLGAARDTAAQTAANVRNGDALDLTVTMTGATSRGANMLRFSSALANYELLHNDTPDNWLLGRVRIRDVSLSDVAEPLSAWAWLQSRRNILPRSGTWFIQPHDPSEFGTDDELRQLAPLVLDHPPAWLCHRQQFAAVTARIGVLEQLPEDVRDTVCRLAGEWEGSLGDLILAARKL